MAVFSCAWALSCVVLGAELASAAGSASHFAKLAGAGRSPVEARSGAVAATLPNGEVLIAGGATGQDIYYLSRGAELFNPATDTFTGLTGAGQTLTEGREGAVAATLPNGEVVIAGGHNESGYSTLAELFIPPDTFTRLTREGQAPIEERAGAVAATLHSGHVLIAGGETTFDIMPSGELFNPATDKFTTLTGAHSPTEPRAGAVAATLPSGQVLIAGGESQTSMSSAELFHPATDTFTKLTGSGHSPTEPRAGAVAATLPSGQVLIAGGQQRQVVGRELKELVLSSAELFNPSTDTFTKLTGPSQSLTEPRREAVAAPLHSGRS